MFGKNRKTAKKHLSELNDKLYHLLCALCIYLETTQTLSNTTRIKIAKIFQACGLDLNELRILPDKLEDCFYNQKQPKFSSTELAEIVSLCIDARASIKNDNTESKQYICKQIDSFVAHKYEMITLANSKKPVTNLSEDNLNLIFDYLDIKEIRSLQLTAIFFYRPAKKILNKKETYYDRAIRSMGLKCYFDDKNLQRAKEVRLNPRPIRANEVMDDVKYDPIMAVKFINQLTLSEDSITQLQHRYYNDFSDKAREPYRSKVSKQVNSDDGMPIVGYMNRQYMHVNESFSDLITLAILQHDLVRYYLRRNQAIAVKLATYISSDDMKKINDTYPNIATIINQPERHSNLSK